MTNAQTKASMKYDRNNTKNIMFKLNLKTDADILAWLESVPNKQGYFKALVRQDMAKGKGGILANEING